MGRGVAWAVLRASQLTRCLLCTRVVQHTIAYVSSPSRRPAPLGGCVPRARPSHLTLARAEHLGVAHWGACRASPHARVWVTFCINTTQLEPSLMVARSVWVGRGLYGLGMLVSAPRTQSPPHPHEEALHRRSRRGTLLGSCVECAVEPGTLEPSSYMLMNECAQSTSKESSFSDQLLCSGASGKK